MLDSKMATKMQLARDVNGLQKEPKVYSLSTQMKMSEMLLLEEEMKSLVVMLKKYKKFPSMPQTWRTC